MKGLLLISGGIDSPVAGYLMKKKGVDLIAVHFSNQPFTDKKPQELAERLLKKIDVKKLYVVKHGLSHAVIAQNINRRYTCVICRRMMYRVAEAIAKKEKCDFLITGENLGQVASQTLSNLASESNAIQIKVFRPLLGMDKNEIVQIARRIKTYKISIEPSICCRLVPKYPKTRTSIEELEREEAKFDVDKLLNERLKDLEVKRL